MINFSTSTLDDVDQIKEWAEHDPYHFVTENAEWWLTSQGFLSFCLQDEIGPICYVRLDSEDGLTRLHTQFAPETIVSKKRLIVGMLEAIKTTIPYLMSKGSQGIIFNSVSPSLIEFMDKQLGFKAVGNDDYKLIFEEQN